MRWIVRALIIAAALAAPALALGGEKIVHLDVEGHVEPVRTYATSSAALLQRIGVDAGSRDMLLPAGALDAGETVTFRRAKVIQLWVDDVPRPVWVHGLTVADALRELGLGFQPADFVAPGRDVPVVEGMAVYVRDAVHTKVRVDGAERDVVSSATTIRDLLTHAGISLGPRDYVRPTLDTRPEPGMRIRVVRVDRVVTEEHVRVPFSYVERPDATLERGVRRVAQEGAEGLIVRRISATLEDGEPLARRVLSEEVVRPARDQVVRVGTKQPAFRGQGRAQTGEASWYRTQGFTAAHRTLPFGTMVKVTNLANGRTVTVRINDRGPFVEGRIIDLSDAAFGELAPLGAGIVRVRIEW